MAGCRDKSAMTWDGGVRLPDRFTSLYLQFHPIAPSRLHFLAATPAMTAVSLCAEVTPNGYAWHEHVTRCNAMATSFHSTSIDRKREKNAAQTTAETIPASPLRIRQYSSHHHYLAPSSISGPSRLHRTTLVSQALGISQAGSKILQTLRPT